ncbi:AAA family ATPase [Kitasatospora sp. NBC_01302]|uniref:AAA family ATPase n=1 Tax=Kitasatospora sp. NBC_01302 TaxID=2903575 RepID=UPI002E0FC3B4|nr:AAA family ATPase [Kitasatospora sp. NBC_01302]
MACPRESSRRHGPGSKTQLIELSVTNFRSLADVQGIPIRKQTILTGHNDCGKTATLDALAFLLGERSGGDLVLAHHGLLGGHHPTGQVSSISPNAVFSESVTFRAWSCRRANSNAERSLQSSQVRVQEHRRVKTGSSSSLSPSGVGKHLSVASVSRARVDAEETTVLAAVDDGPSLRPRPA